MLDAGWLPVSVHREYLRGRDMYGMALTYLPRTITHPCHERQAPCGLSWLLAYLAKWEAWGFPTWGIYVRDTKYGVLHITWAWLAAQKCQGGKSSLLG